MDLRVLDVERGHKGMTINGRRRPAYEWCEMFGHQMDGDTCSRCGGGRITSATRDFGALQEGAPAGVPVETKET